MNDGGVGQQVALKEVMEAHTQRDIIDIGEWNYEQTHHIALSKPGKRVMYIAVTGVERSDVAVPLYKIN